MAKIDAKMVKELRERTGAGMMDCKKALTETDGDMDKAIDYLREKGIAKAEKITGIIPPINKAANTFALKILIPEMPVKVT